MLTAPVHPGNFPYSAIQDIHIDDWDSHMI